MRANVTEQKEKKTRMFDVQGESERVTNSPVFAIYACTFFTVDMEARDVMMTRMSDLVARENRDRCTLNWRGLIGT